MKRVLYLLLCLGVAWSANAQGINRQNLASILGFENNSRAGVFPVGWSGSSGNVISTDDQVFHGGKFSAHIERNVTSSGSFSTLNVTIPLDFAGKTIEWRGFLKRENVTGFAALWMRVDGDTPNLAFATLQGLNLNGTKDWEEYSISVPAVLEGKQVIIGFLLSGSGKAWVDDLQLLVDGKPVAQADPRQTVLDTDHEFDQGSRVQLSGLSNIQIQNLATLAKVWGFLKYHHPEVVSGRHHWDYDLFRVLPRLLGAADRAAANEILSLWVAALGAVEKCSPCAGPLSGDVYLNPDIEWIKDEAALGVDLSQRLQVIYRDRNAATKQFYVSLTPGVENPVFENELSYRTLRLPDSGYQLLALFRFWNMVQYFYPNRDIMADDPDDADYWNSVLTESIPGIALAPDALTYQQQLMRFIAKIHDTHANLWSSLAARPPIGSCQLPVDVSFVEGRPLVLRHISATAGPASGLMPGDVIEQLDGIAVDELLNRWAPLYADSNEAARLRDIGRYMTRGPCGPAAVVVQRGATRLSLQSSRVPTGGLDFSASNTHDLPGDNFIKLTDDIAYLKLSSVTASKSAGYIASSADTRGLVIDIRNYPSEFVVFTLGQLLVSEPTPFVRFTKGALAHPGAFLWTSPISLTPQEPHYSGKVVILVDEVTQSQAEYTAMAFRTAPGAIVLGSTTAGADGNVSTVPLPGGLSSYISGIGVFYPDKRPTQRIGIIPDIEVRPTIKGIRAGRDELIEEAIRQITLDQSPAARGTSFSLKDHEAVSFQTPETSAVLYGGYASIQTLSGSTPAGLAIIGSRQNDVLVYEANVPASPLIQSGRIYAEKTASVNTGLAMGNPNSQNATISFYFTDSTGDFGKGTTTIPSKGQIVAFLDQTPFHGRSNFSGTFTFTATQPVAVVAMRGLVNERGDFLLTPLPVADLNAPLSRDALVFPRFADGGGWSTQIVLTNPTNKTLTGTVEFRDPSGMPATVFLNHRTMSAFAYSILPRSSQKLQTAGSGVSTTFGSLRVVPGDLPVGYTPAPSGLVIVSFRNGRITVSEAGIPAVPEGNAFRLYVEASGDFDNGAIGSIQTGLAITHTSSTAAPVSLELFGMDGISTGLTGTVVIPANGQVAGFLNRIPGLNALRTPFQGTLRVSSPTPVSVIALRGRYNERSEILIAPMPPVNEANPSSRSPLYFPHLAFGAGYSTQFVLFSGPSGPPSSGILSLFSPFGALMTRVLP